MKQNGYTVIELIVLITIPLFVYGWVANIIKFIASDFSFIDGMLLARAIGIFIAPVGVVLGFVP